MRKITCLLLLLCLLPSFALADKTITLTFTGDITLGGEDYLRTAEDSFFAVYEREGADTSSKTSRISLPRMT